MDNTIANTTDAANTQKRIEDALSRSCDTDTIDFREIYQRVSPNANFCQLQTIDLTSSKEVYPKVKTLIIPRFLVIKMPNSMFPNLESVVDNHGKVSNGMYRPYLYSPLRPTILLYKHADEPVSLKKVRLIEDYAFDGCRSTQVLLTEDVRYCREHAFDGSIFEEMPRKNGVLMVGSILAYIDENAEVIDIPDFITIAKDDVFMRDGKPIHVKKHIIHDWRTLSIIHQQLDVDTLVFDLLLSQSIERMPRP